jgi:hypothetical protein
MKHCVFSATLGGGLIGLLEEGALPFLKIGLLISEPSPFLAQDLPHLAVGRECLLTHQPHPVRRSGAASATLKSGSHVYHPFWTPTIQKLTSFVSQIKFHRLDDRTIILVGWGRADKS